jgi:hypothetical protein
VRIWTTLAATGLAAVTATALAAAPALADPVSRSAAKPVTPSPWDIVGVGAGSILYVSDQLARNYDRTIKKDTPSTPYVYEWGPGNLNGIVQPLVVVKAGCKPGVPPPDISALGWGITTYKGTTYPCVDFIRSERARQRIDPHYARGGVAFVTFAGDAVTYSSTRVSNVPNDLSRARLADIFGCTIHAAHGFKAGTWGALLGPKAKDATGSPDPIVPQAGSGTLQFWMEKALGLPTDTEPACGSLAGVTNPARQPEENEGISPAFALHGKPNPNVIFPFSVAAYVAQEAHSAACGKPPTKGQNAFGCDETGVLRLDGIGAVIDGKTTDVAPTVPSHGVPVTNPLWNRTAFHTLEFDVVSYSSAKGNVNHIAPRLMRIFGPHGYWCTNPAVLGSYGFEPTPSCGMTS